MENTILFLGDLFYDFDFIPADIENIAAWIQENKAVTVLNLESPIGQGEGKAIKKRGPNLSSNVCVIDVLKKLNVVGVCLANNHMMDYGEDALKDTLALLDEHGIKHCGAGMNLDSAVEPMEFLLGDRVVSILNFGWDVEETIYVGGGYCGMRSQG